MTLHIDDIVIITSAAEGDLAPGTELRVIQIGTDHIRGVILGQGMLSDWIAMHSLRRVDPVRLFPLDRSKTAVLGDHHTQAFRGWEQVSVRPDILGQMIAAQDPRTIAEQVRAVSGNQQIAAFHLASDDDFAPQTGQWVSTTRPFTGVEAFRSYRVCSVRQSPTRRYSVRLTLTDFRISEWIDIRYLQRSTEVDTAILKHLIEDKQILALVLALIQGGGKLPESIKHKIFCSWSSTSQQQALTDATSAAKDRNFGCYTAADELNDLCSET